MEDQNKDRIQVVVEEKHAVGAEEKPGKQIIVLLAEHADVYTLTVVLLASYFTGFSFTLLVVALLMINKTVVKEEMYGTGSAIKKILSALKALYTVSKSLFQLGKNAKRAKKSGKEQEVSQKLP